MKLLLSWLDQRTGYKALMVETLNERVPGGARWRYVWGSTLVFVFVVQVITGLGLWMSYSPSSNTAWESVYYIQHDMALGWLLRGIHHFMAQAMIVLMGLHLLQVVIDGAYRAPREVNFWLGLILMQIVLGLSLTGYLLPWDQKGYWATKVATNIAGITPVIGTEIQRIAVGGSDYGHHTLTRFFMLHAGLLPVLLVVFLAAHVYVFRRHGLHAPNPLYRPDTTFWPDQVLRDAVACLAVLVAVILVMWKLRGFGPDGGAELGAPANPAEQYGAARPEWYFLFLFQLLKYFPGTSEVYGAIYIPGLIMGALFLMPFVGKSTLGHRANIVFLFGVLAGAGYLTVEAVRSDMGKEDYKLAVEQAEHESKRVKELVVIKGGIPPEGAGALLKHDFINQGPKLFARHCASCHVFTVSEGPRVVATETPNASDLGPFGTREWLKGIITNSGDKKFLGSSPGLKAMSDWSKKHGANMTETEVDAVAEFLIGTSGRKGGEPDKARVKAGRTFYMQGAEEVEAKEGSKARPAITACIACHRHTGDEELTKQSPEEGAGPGPELSDYASEAWLLKMIGNPADESLYPDTNAMPAFEKSLSAEERQMLVDWMLRKNPDPRQAAKSETAAAP